VRLASQRKKIQLPTYTYETLPQTPCRPCGDFLVPPNLGATLQRSTAGGTPDFRLFQIDAGADVTIDGLTVMNGHVVALNFGGGIYNRGTLTVRFAPPPNYDQRGPGFDRLRDGRIDIGAYEVQCPPVAFTNTTTITIPAIGPASPYPSNISVSGLSGTVVQVTVTINGLLHAIPDDLDFLLVGPAGQNAIIWSDAGGSRVHCGP